jgi:hypothetical protein
MRRCDEHVITLSAQTRTRPVADDNCRRQQSCSGGENRTLEEIEEKVETLE